jgi:hypothetical protein
MILILYLYYSPGREIVKPGAGKPRYFPAGLPALT